MMFVVSKCVGWVLRPLNAVFLLLLVSVIFNYLGRPAIAKRVIQLALGVAVVIGYLPFSYVALRGLEYSVPNRVINFNAMHGVIILGGAIDVDETSSQNVGLNDAAERLTVPLGLMKRFDHLQLLHTGYSGSVFVTGSEADGARRFFSQQGIEANRVLFESRSRNTLENAWFTLPIVGTANSWILVTSAAHMPRSYEKFRDLGIKVVPLSVDFHTQDRIPWWHFDLHMGAEYWRIVLHEWVGRVVYWILE